MAKRENLNRKAEKLGFGLQRQTGISVALVAITLVCPSVSWADPAPSTAEASQTGTGFGGKSSVTAQIAADRARQAEPMFTDASKDYYNYKDRLLAESGLSFGGDINLLTQHANSSPGARDATGSVLRFYGTWTATGRGTPDSGALVFKIENRSKIGGTIAPQGLGPALGYAGLTAVGYSDAGWLLTNLYWQQAFNNNTVSFVAGIVDTTDYVDVFALGNPWTDFNNLAFSTNPTIPAPNQGLGAAVRVRFGGNYFGLAGIADANGMPDDPVGATQNLFDTGETFKHVAVGWFGSWASRFDKNVQLTAWQVDDRSAAGIAGGWGVAFSANTKFDSGWSPFFKAGYSDGGGTFVDRSVSIGTGYDLFSGRDLVAVGLNWGRAPKSATLTNPPDQVSTELFYRYQPFSNLQITPSLQLITNPTYDPTQGTVAVVSLRARVTF
ncbi:MULTISPECIES: carbohydrate porin [unclassified Falsihalocynthiibacter]|uniref:carbohydrate porin n=1 Tax=unclassified Falsihalocynthiibacter TaxID=2854191 RepID=UPI00350EA821